MSLAGGSAPALDVGQDFRLKTYAGHYKSSFNSWGITMTSRRSPLLPDGELRLRNEQDPNQGHADVDDAVRDIRRSGRTALYWVHPPMNRSDVIDPETKSRGATPS